MLSTSSAIILGLSYISFTTKPPQSDTYCQLGRTPCINDQINIRLSHDIVKPMIATEVDVVWPSLPVSVENLEFILEGHEMMMGQYRLKLSRTAQDNRYNGQIILPFCTSDAMTWKGTITPSNHEHEFEPVFISLRMEK